jgi:hypothetical protein
VTTLRLLERERVTLFRGWPDQGEALARQSASVGADLSALRPGSLDALLPPEQRGNSVRGSTGKVDVRRLRGMLANAHANATGGD